MTVKVWVILIVVLSSLYQLVLSILQYRSANNPTPNNVADVYDRETYQKWKQYSGENSRLSIFSTVVSCLVSIVLLATDSYAAFAGLFPAGVFVQLLAVLFMDSVITTLVNMVFEYISTMVIEQKYGFNRTTGKTFLLDQLRSLAFSLILGLILVCLLWQLHGWLGDAMVVVFAVAVFCVMLAISFLYPFISRIGNKFVPLEDGDLKDRLMELLTKHGYQVKAIEVMDASRRTTKLNAYFTGFGKTKTIVLYDNLVNTMTTQEICAVFSHELGHGLHKDVLKMQILNFGNLLLMSVMVWLVCREPSLSTAFGFHSLNYAFVYLLLGVFLGLLQPVTGIITNAYSRHAEYRADGQAVKEGYGSALITALKKLARENFAHLAPSPVNVVLEYRHPPLSRRIEEVEKALAAK